MTILLSNQKAHETFHATEKRIKIKPLAEISRKTGEVPTTEGLDDPEATYQEKLQSARQELKQINDKKEQMMQEARDKIAKEREEWEQTKETLGKQAQDEGFHSGFQAGMRESKDQYQNLLRQANQIIETAKADYDAKLEQSEDAIIDLAVHVARKIIHRQLQEEPATLVSIVQDAIKEIKNQPTIAIYVHPDYYEVVSRQKEELARLVHGVTVLTIYTDDELDANGCVIEHPFGKIDASVDTQLLQLREVLHDITMETES